MPIVAIDHIAFPIQREDAMAAFYRALGFDVRETERVIVVHAGNQKMNLHRPNLWQDPAFTLRSAPSVPGSADLCFVFEGGAEAAASLIAAAGAALEEGPVARIGGRDVEGTSVYTRDPDGNLVELICYP
jgi:catechol 2,3-dioxygenase-like lactoylglutathione lyase family enzyme